MQMNFVPKFLEGLLLSRRSPGFYKTMYPISSANVVKGNDLQIEF